jgi:UPF0755 protein
MKRKYIYIIRVLLSLVFFISSLLGGYWLIKKPNILLGQEPRLLIIPSGLNFSSLQDTLYQKGYITDSVSFSLLARLLRYDRKFLSGAYKLQPDMSNWEAIRLLKSGKQAPIKLVLDHVYTQFDLISKVSQHTGIQFDILQNLLEDSTFVSQWGFNTANILAMFIPNTYEIYWNISPQDFFQRMYREYQRFWNPDRINKAQKMELTPVEVVILAAIVQKETNKLEEASIIAGIYLNRLKKGMRLQACPTLLYAAGDTSARRVLKKYQQIDSPYNTYLYKGLPPGPISIPSIAMIEAVLNYKPHNYLFFSAKEDFSGYHYFAKTFSEHTKNGEKYRRALNKAQIYQ